MTNTRTVGGIDDSDKVHPLNGPPRPHAGGDGAGTDLGRNTLLTEAPMFNHLFDIDGKSVIEFERIDFGVQEVSLDGEIVWWRRYGQRDLEI